MATHSSILAWRTPWTEEPGGLQSMRLQRIRHAEAYKILQSCNQNTSQQILFPSQKRNTKHENRNENGNIAIKKKKTLRN